MTSVGMRGILDPFLREGQELIRGFYLFSYLPFHVFS